MECLIVTGVKQGVKQKSVCNGYFDAGGRFRVSLMRNDSIDPVN